jgi:hypothetical protein
VLTGFDSSRRFESTGMNSKTQKHFHSMEMKCPTLIVPRTLDSGREQPFVCRHFPFLGNLS